MATRRGALLGRIVASLALLAFAALGLASGIDRMSARSPALSRLLPPEIRVQAARAAANLAIIQQRPANAVAHARQAVRADPVHPSSAGLLGTAYLMAGDTRSAEAAFRVAARFGWRDTPTQLYWYEAAMQAGDLPRAVDRVDAVLRTRPGFAAAQQMLASLEETPAGREALIVRMQDRPQWLELYLQADEDVDDATLERRGLVLVDLARSGTRLGCGPVGSFASAAVERGARRLAEAVWTAHCPGATLSNGLADGEFDRLGSEDPSPFGWREELSGDVTLSPVTAGRDTVLQMRNRSSVSRLVLRQAVALEPGAYRLRGEVETGRMAASIGCNQAPALPSGVIGDMGGAGQTLQVPACSRLELGLWLRPGDGEVELDSVELDKVG